MADEQLNILHLSDLHLCQDDADQERVFNAFLDNIDTVVSTPLQPTLVAITGDLVRSGDDVSSYTSILDRLIIPLLDRLGLTTDDVIVVPGNHDARQSIIKANESFHDTALALKTREEIDAFYKAHSSSDYLFEKFSHFGSLQAALGNANVVKSNPFYTTYHYKKLDLTAVALNSALLTLAHTREGQSDKDRLLLPELAFYEAQKSLPSAKTKLILTHHPFSWLLESNAVEIQRSMPADCLYLFGHVHDPRPEQSLTPNGSISSCQSGALYTKRKFYNGYSIISVSPDRKHTKITYRSYFDNRRRFDVATDILTDGTFYASKESETFWLSQPSRVTPASVRAWITTAIAPAIREELQDGLTGRALNEIFVAPRLSLTAEFSQDPNAVRSNQDAELSWTEFVVSDENHVVRGKPEFGKTSILRQLTYEMSTSTLARAIPRVPIFVRFSDIPKSGKKLLAALRSAIPECPAKSYSFSQLAEDGYLCLLIDDVDFHDTNRLTILSEFMKLYPQNRYILTTSFDQYEAIGRIKSADFPVATKDLFLSQFGRGRFRKIVQNMISCDKFQQEALLNRIMLDMRSMNVPATAANAAILLTIFQSEQAFVPVNRAIAQDRFIDIMLKRYGPDEARRSTFDYKNKTDLLAKVAGWMCEKSTYTPEYADIYEFVSAYLQSRALTYDAQKIIAELITSRVLTNRANAISFRYRSYLEFFVAKEMEENKSFREWVFEEDRYLSFINEIEYYSGLNRNNEAALQLVGDRYLAIAQSVRSQIGELGDLSLLDKLPSPQIGKGVDTYGLIHNQLKLPPVTDEERDALIEGDFPTEIPGQDVYRPLFSDDAQRWVMCLFLYSRMLRNMELVPRPVKVRAVKEIIHGWGELLVRSIQANPSLAKHRKIVINGIRYGVLAPAEINEDKLLRFLMLNSPRTVGQLLLENAGSEKLQGVLAADEEFKSETLIEKFFRKMLYADLQLPEFITVISRLYDDLVHSSYILEGLIWKLQHMYRRVLLSDSQDNAFRRVLAKAIAHNNGSRGRDADVQEARELQRLERHHIIDVFKRKLDS